MIFSCNAQISATLVISVSTLLFTLWIASMGMRIFTELPKLIPHAWIIFGIAWLFASTPRIITQTARFITQCARLVTPHASFITPRIIAGDTGIITS